MAARSARSTGSPRPSRPSRTGPSRARFLYNVYCRACTSGIQATTPTKKYVSELNGWICKTASKHAVDPITGDNFATEIDNTISASGFVNIPDGPVGGGVNGVSGCRLFTT